MKNRSFVLAFTAVILIAGCATPQYSFQPYAIASDPEMTAEQAWAICGPEAELSALQARNAALSGSQSSASANTSYRCNTNATGYGNYQSTCSPQGSGMADALSQVGNSIAAESTYQQVYSLTIRACMAAKGWGLQETCVQNCN